MATTFIRPPPHPWPVGFGFRPTEDELFYYLNNKMLGNDSLVQCVRELDLYKYEPWELPEQSVFKSDNYEWFFFRAQHPNGHRPKRTTATGYWKSTGEPRPIKARGSNEVIGARKILVFHKGKSPNGVKTNWVIHEYHLQLDAHIPYQRSFVICRLKENAEEKCDEHKQNSRFASHNIEKNVTERVIQGNQVFTETGANVFGSSFPIPEPQPANGYYCEANWQVMQPEAIDNEDNLTEWLNSIFVEDEHFDGVTSKDCIDRYNDEADLQSSSDLMDFQCSSGHDGQVNRQLSQPGASESDVNLTEILNSVFVEDENFEEVTSNSNKAELESMVYELQYGGFSSDTYNDAAFGWQNNQVSPSWFDERTSSRVQMRSMATIKESRRSPLAVKHLQYKKGKDSGGCREFQGDFCGEVGARDSDDDGARTWRTQHQAQCGDIPKRVRLVRGKAISQDKAKEDEKCIQVVGWIADSSNGKGKSCYTDDESKGNILTTKRIHHKSSQPLVYVAKAFLGIIMFVIFLQKMLLYGNWW